MKPFKDRRGEHLKQRYLWAVAEAKIAIPEAEVMLSTCDHDRALEMLIRINASTHGTGALIFVTYLVEPSTDDNPPTPRSKDQIREFIADVASKLA